MYINLILNFLERDSKISKGDAPHLDSLGKSSKLSEKIYKLVPLFSFVARSPKAWQVFTICTHVWTIFIWSTMHHNKSALNYK